MASYFDMWKIHFASISVIKIDYLHNSVKQKRKLNYVPFKEVSWKKKKKKSN